MFREIKIKTTSKWKSKVKKLKFKKIDAFATSKSDGNPAGYIHVSALSDLTESEMQRIAKELKGFVNEVGFIAQASERSFSLKFFSSECEVDFCGHATIAIMYDLIINDENLNKYETVCIQTNRGVLTVENKIRDEDAVYIMSPTPIFYPMQLNVDTICRALKIAPSTILSDQPLSIINAGLATLIIPIRSINEMLDISPDYEVLKKFCLESDIDIIEVFTSDVVNVQSNYRVRVFAPKFGYLEDPATGSGNSALGYYLVKNNYFDRETITIEQNGDRNRYNIVKLRKGTDSENNDRILFGGSAITRIDGSYILH